MIKKMGLNIVFMHTLDIVIRGTDNEDIGSECINIMYDLNNTDDELFKLYDKHIKKISKYLPILRLYLICTCNVINTRHADITSAQQTRIAASAFEHFKEIYDTVGNDFQSYLETKNEGIINRVIESLHERINKIIQDVSASDNYTVNGMTLRLVNAFINSEFLTEKYADTDFLEKHAAEVIDNLCQYY